MPAVEVVALEYSGREDRTWRITKAADFDTLRRFLEKLPKVPDPEWPALGPRGFMLINHQVKGLPEEVRVFQGVIAISENGTLHFFRDVHGLEDWLRSLTSSR